MERLIADTESPLRRRRETQTAIATDADADDHLASDHRQASQKLVHRAAPFQALRHPPHGKRLAALAGHQHIVAGFGSRVPDDNHPDRVLVAPLPRQGDKAGNTRETCCRS